MKVFFDSNFWVSFSIQSGAARKAFRATLHARWRMRSSRYVLDETGDVLSRKFGYGPRDVKQAVSFIEDVCELVLSYGSQQSVPGDPDDTPILNAAMATNADYLVTRDRHLLSLVQVESLRIVTLADYLDVLRARGVALD